MRVRSVTDDRVRFTGRSLGNASYGTCSRSHRGTSSSDGAFRIDMGAESTAVEKGPRVEVVAIEDGRTVPRVSPS